MKHNIYSKVVLVSFLKHNALLCVRGNEGWKVKIYFSRGLQNRLDLCEGMCTAAGLRTYKSK